MYRTDFAIPGWDYGGTGQPGDPFHFVTPGKAYWFINKHVGNTWAYNYVAVPNLPMRMNNNEAVVTSTSRKANDSAKSTVRANTSVKKNTTAKSSTKVRTNK
jgi:hypothetical protein